MFTGQKKNSFRQIFRERKRGKLAFATLWMKQSCLLKRESTFHYKLPVSCKPEIHTLQTKLLLFYSVFFSGVGCTSWPDWKCFVIYHSLNTGECKIWENIKLIIPLTQVNGKSGKISNVFQIASQAVHKTFHNLLLILNMFDMVRETCTFVTPHFGTRKSELFFSDHFVFWISNLGIHPSTDLPLIQKIYLAKEREIGSNRTHFTNYKLMFSSTLSCFGCNAINHQYKKCDLWFDYLPPFHHIMVVMRCDESKLYFMVSKFSPVLQ